MADCIPGFAVSTDSVIVKLCQIKGLKILCFSEKIKNIKISKISDINQNIKIS